MAEEVAGGEGGGGAAEEGEGEEFAFGDAPLAGGGAEPVMAAVPTLLRVQLPRFGSGPNKVLAIVGSQCNLIARCGRNGLKDLLKRAARPFGLGIYRLGNEDGLLEPAHLRRFLSYFKIDCVFDVGANQGQYARRLRTIGFDGLILSFEPHPTAFEKLREVSAPDGNWMIYSNALSSQVRQLDFKIMAASQFSSLLAPDHSNTELFTDMNKVVRSVPITTATLNDLFPAMQAKFGFKRPFLKLDTQGHDVDVVKGGLQVADNFVGLQSELALTRLYEGAPTFEESLAFYRSLGFKLSSLVPNNAGHFPDLVEVDCIMYRPDK